MIFMLYCRMNAERIARAEELLDRHREYLRNSPIELKGAGQTLSDDGREIIGIVYIFEAESREKAESFYALDPFSVEGVWDKTLLELYNARM